MLLGFHGATTMTSDLQTDIQVSAFAGFKALELWAAKIDRYLEDHPISDLKALLDGHGVAPMAVNSIEFIAFRGAEYAQIQHRCRQLSEIAQAIGCPAVVVVPSPIPSHETTWEAIVEEYVTVLRDLADIAAPYGVKLTFESLGFGWCTVRTPRGAWEIVQKTGRDNVGLTVDCAHFYGGGGLLSELDVLDPARIFAFHLDDVEDVAKEAITDARRLLPGQGIVPLDDICVRLKNIGYDGPCSIELFRPEYWEWDPRKLAVKARAAAMSILSPHFQVA
ncbi:MAG: sugar phosphate isomerase/epimerase family protein [Chloroflexota bacterium]|nr:sugar phosphate isomerase/epimerase family protein [Chloroflexota bacterium]